MSNEQNITLFAADHLPNTGGWKDRHNSAIASPRGIERGIVHMLNGWAEYAKSYQDRWKSPIGEDGVLGQYWQDAGSAIKGLLDGDTVRLDCGTLSSYLYDFAKANGIDPEEL